MKTNRARISGFTIIELLVVIAISVVLLALVLAPVIKSFQMTAQTSAMVQAQDTARTTLEQVSREIGQAMFVYDNSNSLMNFPVEHPDGTKTVVTALYGKIDLMLPKLMMHCNNPNHPAGSPRDYERGDDAWPLCPECIRAGIAVENEDIEARPKQPLSGESKIVRYFIGLKCNDPAADPRINPAGQYRDWAEGTSPINGFVLYRAEFDPTDPNLFPVDPNDPNRRYVDDPNFFYNQDRATDGNNEFYWKNWAMLARPVVPKADMDLIKWKLDSAGNLIDSVMPSVRFQLTRLSDDSFAPSHITDEAAESPTAVPTLYRASYGAWGTARGASNPNPYSVSLARYNATSQTNDIWYRADWVGSDLIVRKYGGATPTDIFNVSNYISTGAFPSGNPEVAFVIDPIRGEVRFDFPASDVINKATIEAMNKVVRDSWGPSSNPPTREYKLSMFQSGTCPYKIVPGSEIIMGPDMSPGVDAGKAMLVRYERVPYNLGDPGRNQYKIDYGMSNSGDTGRIIFSPAYDEVIPEKMIDGPDSDTDPDDGRFEISYKFQCNQDGDIVTGNYSTKNLLTVTMGIRFYDRGSGKVQPVELTNKVRVRNLMR